MIWWGTVLLLVGLVAMSMSTRPDGTGFVLIVLGFISIACGMIWHIAEALL